MNNSSKKILLTCLLGVFAAALAAQLSLELRSGFNDEICPGFDTDDNTIIIEVLNSPPVPPAANTKIEYYWLITHELGEWIYQTNNPVRPFLVTLDGEHTIRCRLLYVNEITSFPYAAFWSAPLIVQTGTDCN